MNSVTIKKYILDTFSDIYDIPANLKISYGEEEEADISVRQGDLSFFDKQESIPEDFIWHSWNDKNIPFPLNKEEEPEVITTKGGKVIINYDVFAASFYFLSSWQEIHRTETDSYGRFPFKLSFQYKHDLILVPVVNYYFEILKTAIEKHAGTSISRRHSKAPFTAFLSHDIDSIHSGWRQDSTYELKKGNIKKASSIITKRLAREKDEWNNLDVIVELEKLLGVVSTFFILASKGGMDADYEVKDVSPYFDMIEEAHSEIGVHGSLDSGFDGKLLKREIQDIGREITGNRYHFLQNNVKITPQILDDAGMKYDSSLCFDDHIGFRNGFCFPFRPFNFATQKAYNHFQIPLLIMDSTMYVEDYMGNLPYEESKRRVDVVMNEVESFGGIFTLLWHNTYFTNHKYAGWGPRYVQIVKELKDKGAEFLTGAEIAQKYHEA